MIDWHYEEFGEDGEILLLRLSGKLESTGCEYPFAAIEEQIREGRKRLIIDCDGLEFISRVGLSMLLRLHAKMKRHGGELTLVGIDGPVANVIRLIKMDKVFGTYPTVKEAMVARDA
jgi:anti-sigma B factor antagonist